jgi:hypothetical protein
MCDRSHLSEQAIDSRASRPCSICKAHHADSTVLTGTTEMDEHGYRVVVVTLCPECRRDPQAIDRKFRHWARRLRAEADVIESLSPVK